MTEPTRHSERDIIFRLYHDGETFTASAGLFGFERKTSAKLVNTNYVRSGARITRAFPQTVFTLSFDRVENDAFQNYLLSLRSAEMRDADSAYFYRDPALDICESGKCTVNVTAFGSRNGCKDTACIIAEIYAVKGE